MTTQIRLAFSPDSDDLFMFYALLRGKIDTRGYTFVYERADTEALNAMAERGEMDVCAVSMAQYARIANDYLILPHGASVGRNYGPVVVANPTTPSNVVATEQAPLASLAGKRVGIPGLRTTAYAILELLAPAFTPVVLPIAPYSRVFEALRSGEVDAALIIHEGRLTYEREGFARIVDLGEAWQALTGLPLPLGGNAIRRGLGEKVIAEVSDLCRESIAWALEHREEVMAGLLAEEAREDVSMDRALLDRYLTMYANEDTRTMLPDVKEAIGEIFARRYAAGKIAAPVPVAFAP
jgi:1,4-dihydroxy-6-naphthoate synthase